MGVFFEGEIDNDSYFERLLLCNDSIPSIGFMKSTQNFDEFKSNIEYLSRNVNIEIDNLSIIEDRLSKLKMKLRNLNSQIKCDFQIETNYKNKTLFEILNSLNDEFLKRKELICKQIGVPSSEEELINSAHNKSTLELLKEIGFYENLKKKYDRQNCLNIVAILGGDQSYSIEVIKIQTIYFSFCYYIGLIEYLEEYYSKINNKGVEKKIGQFLTEISNFDSRNTYSTFRRYYKNRKDPNSRHFALNENNIIHVSGMIK